MAVHADKLLEGAGPQSVRIEHGSIQVSGRERYVATYKGMSIAITKDERDALLARGIAWQDEIDPRGRGRGRARL